MAADRSTRVQRVERELLEVLSHFLLHGLGEPLPCYSSITAVEVSPDLRYARVFFRLVGKENMTRKAEETLARWWKRLQRAAKVIDKQQKQIARLQRQLQSPS